MLADMSRTKRPRNNKIAHTTGNKVHQFQDQRSNVKVTRSANVETGSTLYRPKRKAYKLETWYTCGVRRPVSPTSYVTYKIGRNVAHPTGNKAHQVYSQRSRSPGRLMLARGRRNTVSATSGRHAACYVLHLHVLHFQCTPFVKCVSVSKMLFHSKILL